MVANGNLKMVLLGIVGAIGTGIGGFKHYLGSSVKAMSHEERTRRKLRSCVIYKATGFNAQLTKETASINTITRIGNAENFLNGIKGENLFKKAVSKRCIELFDSNSPRKNIYVWRGRSTSFTEGNDKWYYIPILQQTDWLQKGLDLKKKATTGSS